MRICDFCGSPRLLTVESKQTAHVICSRCVWASVDQLVEHAKRSSELDASAMSEPAAQRDAS